MTKLTPRELRDMIATTRAGDTDRILDICESIVTYMQLSQAEFDARLIRVEIELNLNLNQVEG